MKLKVRSDDASTLREYGWPQMGDWLAQLRDESRGELACPRCQQTDPRCARCAVRLTRRPWQHIRHA
jgi:hypothetical protein